MNPFEMVVLIVAISAVASIFRAKYGYGRKGRDRINNRRDRFAEDERMLPEPDGEADRLREEVRTLKDRIQVLERIVTDGERDRGLSLEREIDALRDRK